MYELRLKSPTDGKLVSRAEYYRLCKDQSDPNILGDAYKQADKDVKFFSGIANKLNSHAIGSKKLWDNLSGHSYFLEVADAMNIKR